MKLPVTVVLPTLNCREKLVKHLDAIQSWLPDAGQIIAIDSRSNDGTFELLQDRLSPYGAEVISADRGLYQCWNRAAQLATHPFLYYSTICDVISAEGLRELTAITESNGFDVVISTPRIVSSEGKPEQVKWPIHYIRKYLQFHNGLAAISREELKMLVPLFSPASIIGSSASNLYRTQVIKDYPFPTDVGVVGDSYWALMQLPRLNVGIVDREYATFCWDGVRNGTWDESGEIMKKFKAAAKSLHYENHVMMQYIHEVVIPSYTDHMRDECKRLQAAVNEYDAYVKFLTRPFNVKAKDTILKYSSVRYWLRRLFPRE